MIVLPVPDIATPVWLIAVAAVLGLIAAGYVRRVLVRYGTASPSGTVEYGTTEYRTAQKGNVGTLRPRQLPVVLEVLTAALFGVLCWKIGWTPGLPAYLYFALVAVQLAIIDLRRRLLPNAIVLPALGICFLLLTAAAALGGHWGFLVRGMAAALVLFLVYLALALISPQGLGMGDVKLAALLGLVLGYRGWDVVLAGAFLGFLLGALASLVVVTVRRGTRKSTIPFGPCMVSGALLAILWL